MNRCIIIGGADINNYDYIKHELRADDFFVFCDSGLKHMSSLQVNPNLIVGDFDSYDNPKLDIETITLPKEKDDTDTFYAIKEMVNRGYDEFLLIGVIGARLDHSLANISILLYLNSLGKNASIIDDYSEMEIISNKPVKIPDTYSFFSLINIFGTADGITIKNAKYNLDDATISCEYQYGVSNEVLSEKEAVVSVKEGKLLLIKVF